MSLGAGGCRRALDAVTWVRSTIRSLEGHDHTSCWLRNFVARSAGFGMSGSTRWQLSDHEQPS